MLGSGLCGPQDAATKRNIRLYCLMGHTYSEAWMKTLEKWYAVDSGQ